MSEVKISVVVCTYNRSGYIEKCIESLIDQTLHSSSYEIIVVDNNSTDDTLELCERFKELENFKYFMEPNLGLSYARNRGIKESRASIVAYTDDDAIVSEVWLEALLEAFKDDEVGAAGGPIFPIYESDIPDWFSDSLLPLFSCRDRGGEIFDLEPRIFFYGVNMAIRRDFLVKSGGFRVDLGRKGKSLLSDEELVIFTEIERAGYKKRYMPKAKVDHIVPKERLTMKWLLRRFYWMGKGQAIREGESLNSIGQKIAAFRKKLRRTLRDFRKPVYRAGIYTRLIPLVLFLGYISLKFSRGER